MDHYQQSPNFVFSAAIRLKGGAVQLVVSAVSMGTADHLHHFLLQLSHRQTCDRSAQLSTAQTSTRLSQRTDEI